MKFTADGIPNPMRAIEQEDPVLVQHPDMEEEGPQRYGDLTVKLPNPKP